ncbi:hypothetical protein [Sulfidibacter corallicola]|uniref:Uncharacterized protein n=1 Tax=Sulfidibacter corallicola TaxID=2818388 RepID=A0A8A4TWW1_SULCO|nr:hypothetical protein [Sulfidibacter corallicola]QTD54439.1 hypothetical protein J3U87_29430 [Sulfidibacter corallicola]
MFLIDSGNGNGRFGKKCCAPGGRDHHFFYDFFLNSIFLLFRILGTGLSKDGSEEGNRNRKSEGNTTRSRKNETQHVSLLGVGRANKRAME